MVSFTIYVNITVNLTGSDFSDFHYLRYLQTLHWLNYNINQENIKIEKNVQLKPNQDVLSDQSSLNFRVGHWHDKQLARHVLLQKTNRKKVQSEYQT